MINFSKDLSPAIALVLESCSRALNLKLNIHDLTGTLNLLEKWTIHHHPSCLKHKAQMPTTCIQHCGKQLRRSLIEQNRPLLDTCPFGHQQIAQLVSYRSQPVLVMFAAPFQTETQHLIADIPVVSKPWIQDRQAMMDCIASRFRELFQIHDLDRHPKGAQPRRQLIIHTLMTKLHTPLKIEDLAKVLHLSNSRTGHVIQEIFQCGFPQLLLKLRLEEASRRLRTEAPAIGQLAHDLGFSDQSHFCRSFKAAYGQTPKQWQKKHQMEV